MATSTMILLLNVTMLAVSATVNSIQSYVLMKELKKR